MKKNKYTASESALLKRIGGNIRVHRKRVGIAQEDLAFESKIDRTYMGNIERGETNPSVLKLKDVADILGVDVSEFFKVKGK